MAIALNVVRWSTLSLLLMVSLLGSILAQEVSIPDLGLNAAIREVLQKPNGPLTEQDLLSLTFLDASRRNVRSISGLQAARNLASLNLQLNQLTSLILPVRMTNLIELNLGENQLTNLVLPSDLYHLQTLNLGENLLPSLSLPAGLTNLSELFVTGNLLAELTLPPDMTQVVDVGFLNNPLTTFVLSEVQATNLAGTVTEMKNQGVAVFAYPLTNQLFWPRHLTGAFQFEIAGPPGVYAILESGDLATWSVLATATNNVGSLSFTAVTAHLSSRKFYRTLLQKPPANLVFIPPNTFTMGSPATELHRQANEGPQTTVTLTRGFWIGKYEVTQGEYLEVMGTNPSYFPGDLTRPVSSVSWPDATNYCWLLTQRELAAGRISPGSVYRLPTEAEWECAARAGTTTRFSYGDDPDYASLAFHAWYFQNAGLTVHPVGQKLPNPWGLYDVEGNVWEWTQDWLGDLPGGAVSDPQGPPTNPIGWKVIRGGGYDFAEADCRSARRYFYGNHPALNDSNLGFRVVFAMRE